MVEAVVVEVVTPVGVVVVVLVNLRDRNKCNKNFEIILNIWYYIFNIFIINTNMNRLTFNLIFFIIFIPFRLIHFWLSYKSEFNDIIYNIALFLSGNFINSISYFYNIILLNLDDIILSLIFQVSPHVWWGDLVSILYPVFSIILLTIISIFRFKDIWISAWNSLWFFIPGINIYFILKLISDPSEFENEVYTNSFNNQSTSNKYSNEKNIVKKDTKVHKNSWYNESWLDANWFYKNWYDKNWLDKNWYDKWGRDKNWFNKDWLNIGWYNENWIDVNGFDINWYDILWFNEKWFDKKWFDENWVNAKGEKYAFSDFDRSTQIYFYVIIIIIFIIVKFT